MIKLFLIAAASFLIINFAAAQNDFTITEQVAEMTQGSNNALVLTLDGGDEKTVCKAWQSFTKRYKGKTKHDRKSNITFTDEATIDGMSDNSVDIYAKVIEGEEKTNVMVWFNLGVTYLSSSKFPDRYPTGVQVLTDFAYYVSADIIEEQIKEQKKLLRKEEKDVKKIENKRKKYNKAIEKAEKAIEKNQKELEESEQELAEQTQEVTTVQNKLDAKNEALKETKKIVRQRK